MQPPSSTTSTFPHSTPAPSDFPQHPHYVLQAPLLLRPPLQAAPSPLSYFLFASPSQLHTTSHLPSFHPRATLTQVLPNRQHTQHHHSPPGIPPCTGAEARILSIEYKVKSTDTKPPVTTYFGSNRREVNPIRRAPAFPQNAEVVRPASSLLWCSIPSMHR